MAGLREEDGEAARPATDVEDRGRCLRQQRQDQVSPGTSDTRIEQAMIWLVIEGVGLASHSCGSIDITLSLSAP